MTIKNSTQNVLNILNNSIFIEWRLTRSSEFGEYWSDYIKQNPHLKKDIDEAILLFDLIKINNKKLHQTEQQEIYEKILKKVSFDLMKRRERKRLYARSAAAILLLLLASTLLFFNNRLSKTFGEEIVGQALPDQEIHLINGGEIISLSQNSEIKLSADGSASITDSTNTNRQVHLAKNEKNILIVPFGKRTFLTLADGTKVWLNSGTELEFPTHFRGETREIRMQGEIYLEVAKSDDKPFIVHTPEMNIRVFGTSFNISAYKGDREQSVVLVEGSVQVHKNNQSLKLAPGEMAKISDSEMEKTTVDVSEYISWRGGVLVFNKTPMSEILHKIGRYYNIDFESNPDVRLNEKICSGKLFLSANLDSVMTSVSILTSTTYTRDNQTINIRKKQ